MSYEVLIRRRAQRALQSFPKHVDARIRDALRPLAADPRPPGCKKLRGHQGWRIRIGNYRAVYEIDDAKKTVTILDVGDRKEIYR